ncbi:TIGR03560 family F420-dependent LLM class oxidoreductase [Actinophytocola sediminis]
MKLGLELGAFEWEGGPATYGDTLARVARTADDAGFSLISVGDHVWQGPNAGGEDNAFLESFTTLGVLTAHTSNCLIGPVVAGVHFRHPSMLAKAVTTVDVLSGGRAFVGLGVGWNQQEALGAGIPFPPVADRFVMLEETLRILHQYWEGDRGDERPFDGTHYQLGRALNVPQNLTRPHPPIMLGGGGPKTLRLVATYADACNLYPSPELPNQLELLRRFCADAGRDYDAIEKTCVLPVDVGEDGDGAAALVDQLRQIAADGVRTVIGIVASANPLRQVEIIGEKVLPAVAGA